MKAGIGVGSRFWRGAADGSDATLRGRFSADCVANQQAKGLGRHQNTGQTPRTQAIARAFGYLLTNVTHNRGRAGPHAMQLVDFKHGLGLLHLGMPSLEFGLVECSAHSLAQCRGVLQRGQWVRGLTVSA